MTLVFLDLETTGLVPGLHEVWELAYATDDGRIHSDVVSHSHASADPEALAMNGYFERAFSREVFSPAHELSARIALKGSTLVGANPSFDAAFLRARWGVTPWKYRLLDVETYAMPALGLTEPKGLAFVAGELGVTAPDHTAAGDVATLRHCFRMLRGLYARKPS